MSTNTLEGLCFDRDLGWLEFNRRVLAEAQDERTPLLERLKFLAIFTSNLDEFFMKRIAILRLRPDGSRPQVLEDLRGVIVPLVEEQRACLAALMPPLAGHGVRILGWNDLTERQRVEAARTFAEDVSPALTPQVVDAAHPIPFLSNLSLSWACRLREPGSDAELFGRVKVAAGLRPWLPIREETPAGSHWFLSVTELVRHHLADLFAGPRDLPSHALPDYPRCRGRVEPMTGASPKPSRGRGRANPAAPIRARRAHRIRAGCGPDRARHPARPGGARPMQEAYDLPGAFDLNTLWTLASLDIPALRDSPWTPRVPPALRDRGDLDLRRHPGR